METSCAVEIIGHRGASFDAPENTLAAFRLAYDQGADAAELDVHLTSDGQVLVMHDPDTKRTGGKPGKISEHTAAQIQELNVGAFGKWETNRFHEKAPLLRDVLKIVPPDKRLFIELKSGREILPALIETLKQSGKAPEQMPIITFHFDVAAEAKKLLPKHEVLWLVS